MKKRIYNHDELREKGFNNYEANFLEREMKSVVNEHGENIDRDFNLDLAVHMMNYAKNLGEIIC